MKNLSVIIPVAERFDDLDMLVKDYSDALNTLGLEYEIIFVIDSVFDNAFEKAKLLSQDYANFKILKLGGRFGEAMALTVGFEHSSGNLILTLPAYYQVDQTQLKKMFDALDGNDMVIAKRWPRKDSKLNQFLTRAFHKLLKLMSKSVFEDLGCGVRLFKREVLEEITLYGDQHRFLPVLAAGRGFKIIEQAIPQSDKEKTFRIYSAGVYVRRLLDILTVFFLVKFTKKPLRFFGLVGVVTSVAGVLIALYPVIERLFFGVALSDRPIFFIGSLMLVLGFQILALGLIGELIIFTHAKQMKEYTIETIINEHED